MTARSSESIPLTDDEVVIERIFDAPRALVWQAWTEPERVKRWWGPKDYTTPFCTIDLRVGGAWRIQERSPDGQDHWSTGVYRELVPLERIVCTYSFADEHGNVIPASQQGIQGDWPDDVLVTVTFEDQGDRTKLTVRHVGIPAGEREMAAEGWNQSLDRLAESLRS